MKKNAWILFTKEPIPGKTKTRLMPRFTPAQCADLQLVMLRDLAHTARELWGEVDLYLACADDSGPVLRRLFGSLGTFFPQEGTDIGTRMEYALTRVLNMGYEKVILTGSDIPELSEEEIRKAFDRLDIQDLVFGPSVDGGYYLVGVRGKQCPQVFDLPAYSHDKVLCDTLQLAEKRGYSVSLIDTLADLDTPEDFQALLERIQYSDTLKKKKIAACACRYARLSVIVPVYNEENTIVSMIEQMKTLRERSDSPCVPEILFADGGSTDGTRAILESYGNDPAYSDCFILLPTAKGRANQMNEGAAAAHGEYLLFLHCDSILPYDAEKEIRRVLRKTPTGCFGIRFAEAVRSTKKEQSAKKERSAGWVLLMKCCAVISNVRAYLGIPFGDQGIFLHKKIFLDLGMFPSLPIMEDYAFSRKRKRKHIRCEMTQHRIETSARRFTGRTLHAGKVMAQMQYLRYLYRKGTDIEEIARRYKDIR